MANSTRDEKPQIIKTKFNAKCVRCGMEIEANGQAYWHPKSKDLWHVACDTTTTASTTPATSAPLTDISEARLRRKSKASLIKLAFDCGINAANGIRHRNYNCKKPMLVDALLGRPVDWSGVDYSRSNKTGDDSGEAVTVPTTAPKSVPAATTAIDDEAIRKIAASVFIGMSDSLVSAVTEDVEKLIAAKIAEHMPTIVRVERRDGAKIKKTEGVQHYLFAKLLKLVEMGENIWLTGPAGSGKTQAARNVSKAFGLRFGSIAGNMQLPASKLFGFMNAQGDYVSTDFRDCVENGGVFLFDEADNTNANVLAGFNDVLAADPGELVSFPDAMIKKHANFVGIAAANTIGKGADRVYVGRCQLDGATLDRFIFLDWDYDEALERALALALNSDAGEWIDRVIALRHSATALNIPHIISPRASMKGAQMIGAGFSVTETEDAVVWKGLDSAMIVKIKNHAGISLSR